MMSLLACGSPLRAVEGGEFLNSLGMVFRDVRGTRVKFSIWETRMMDWECYLKSMTLPWEHDPAFSQGAMHPAVNVTLADALAFCDWLTKTERAAQVISGTQLYRLPTNLEWDAVAAAGDSDPFPWGLEWPPPRDAGNYNTLRIEGANDDDFRFTAPVGHYGQSPDGLYDLGGNAWEWARDTTPGAKATGVLRGGSWMHWRREFLATSFKLVVKENIRSPGIGFRCVLENDPDAPKNKILNSSENREQHTQFPANPEVPAEVFRGAVVQQGAVASSITGTRKTGIPPAVAGKVFENSINIKMLPLSGQNFLLGEHEVRIADYRNFVLTGTSSNANEADHRKYPDHPVTGISWTEAEAFCIWLTGRERSLGIIAQNALYRLPTVAEWRLAAMADNPSTDPALFVWGSAWPPPPGVANIQGQGIKSVKSHTHGLIGFYDLAGNAAEWTQDADGEDRLLCGGSWKSRSREELLIRSERRMLPETRSAEIGFRILLEFPEGNETRN